MAQQFSRIRVSEDCELAVRLDDYVLPWETKPPVVMLHGLAESGEAFRRWVPYFATHHLVVRPDLRGYGDSTPMPGDYTYRFAGLGEDIVRLLDALKIERALLIGGKIGGTLALHLAAHFPARVIAVAAVGAPASLTSFDQRAPGWRKQIREQGVEPWVRETTAIRLGAAAARARLVDQADVANTALDAGGVPEDGADGGCHRRPAAHSMSGAGHHHHRLGARQRGRRARLAGDDPAFAARGAAGRFLSRRRDRPGQMRAKGARLLRPREGLTHQ
jgi:pimeloyl-ACP methyl ester carboxylesterase